ncbi:phage tail spike protein [Leuconostoc mesenteroides]|uniref:phage tail spike protein n=1 Tax=Leuconostoc mesenteroides TaxID=1245 RepID=UPI00235DED66|nr:phage tail spike protein [Leuconostoc mesenteroides]
MIYIFDKKQAIIKVLTNDDFTAAHLNFKINTATTFEFSLPASKALPSGSKYVATPHPLNDSKFIMLRLTERIDKTETIDYSAYELAYQELATDGYIEDKRPQNQSALNLMKIALDGSNWELNNVNVSGTATTNFYYVDRLSAISKVVDLLGGEIVFYIEIQGNAISGRYMDYLARQGADTSKVFASGSNLLTVERQSDTSGIYTAILPRGKGEEIDNGKADTPDGYGRRINIADVEWKKSAGKPLDKPKGSIVLSDPDATAEWGQINGNARLLLKTYDDIDDVNVLINSAYKTLQSVNHPQIQYSATVADVGGLSLGDTILIMHGDRDLSYKTRVFEVKYDLLSPDQTELSLGDDLSSNSITSQLNSLNAVADTTSSQTQWTINQIGRPGTTYGATAPDSPKVGDIWFKYLADGGTEIHRWNGNIWELLASPTTADDIAKAVDDAVSQAKSHIDEVKQGLSSDIATAKSQAASLASTAEANAKSEAVSQFNRAESILSEAKKDLIDGIEHEASERDKAVAAANSQAQNYVNQAKRDINDTINALSVGGRNLYLNSRALADGYGVNGNARVTVEPFDSTTNMWHIVAPQSPGTAIGIYIWDYAGGKIPNNSDWSYSANIKGTGKIVRFGIEESNRNPIKGTIGSKWTRISQTGHVGESQAKTLNIYFETTNSPVDVYIKLPKLETGNIATYWSPAPEDVDSTVAKVKLTADGISKFVRDPSGNISSDFQTALSRTSIITGSTLATSIQTQTSSQISSALTDNNGKIISLINQDSSGVRIAGKNIVLDGDTTVTGDFYAKGGNFKNLNASNLTVGTLNGNQVNITNINANNIVSGAISGANLNINLNNGSVVFQKGRINSSDYTTDINIDQGYISTANDNTRALIKQGMIQLVAPNRFDLESSPYMEISNNRGQNTAGAAIVGRDSVSIANSKNAKNIFPAPIGEETFSGLYTGQAFDGGWLPTKVGGANRGVVVAGGTETTWQIVNNSPYIWVGTDAHGSSGYGNRVVIQAEFLHATAVYYQSGSGGANVYVASDGALVKSSSATKYKTNIEHETDSIQGDQLLTIDPATWNDKFEAEQLERYHETGVEPERQINMEGKRYYGIIAEDLVKAGLEELVTRNEETDEVEGVEYSKIGVALIPIVRDLRNRLNEQYIEIERLKDKIK